MISLKYGIAGVGALALFWSIGFISVVLLSFCVLIWVGSRWLEEPSDGS